MQSYRVQTCCLTGWRGRHCWFLYLRWTFVRSQKYDNAVTTANQRQTSNVRWSRHLKQSLSKCTADLPIENVRRRHVGSNTQHCGSDGLVSLAHDAQQCIGLGL